MYLFLSLYFAVFCLLSPFFFHFMQFKTKRKIRHPYFPSPYITIIYFSNLLDKCHETLLPDIPHPRPRHGARLVKGTSSLNLKLSARHVHCSVAAIASNVQNSFPCCNELWEGRQGTKLLETERLGFWLQCVEGKKKHGGRGFRLRCRNDFSKRVFFYYLPASISCQEKITFINDRLSL